MVIVWTFWYLQGIDVRWGEGSSSRVFSQLVGLTFLFLVECPLLKSENSEVNRFCLLNHFQSEIWTQSVSRNEISVWFGAYLGFLSIRRSFSLLLEEEVRLRSPDSALCRELVECAFLGNPQNLLKPIHLWRGLVCYRELPLYWDSVPYKTKLSPKSSRAFDWILPNVILTWCANRSAGCSNTLNLCVWRSFAFSYRGTWFHLVHLVSILWIQELVYFRACLLSHVHLHFSAPREFDDV